jgi:polyisoprenoid-binding protein YceI
VVKFAVTVGIALLVVAGSVPGPVWAGAAAAQRFTIVPAESQAIYRVEETLFREGNRLKVAVGTTNVVRGHVTVDRTNPRNSRLGTIVVNISTFGTDSARRDRAIRERWLESARYPNAEFRPVAFSGLPARYISLDPGHPACRERGRDRAAVCGPPDVVVRGIFADYNWGPSAFF